jgi:hypothetical protein
MGQRAFFYWLWEYSPHVFLSILYCGPLSFNFILHNLKINLLKLGNLRIKLEQMLKELN